MHAGKACSLHLDNTEIKAGKRKIRENTKQSCFVMGNIKKFSFGQTVGLHYLYAFCVPRKRFIYPVCVNILHDSYLQLLYRSH